MNIRKLSTALFGSAVAAGAVVAAMAIPGTAGATNLLSAGANYSVTASPSLNERSAPSTSAAIVGSLPYGTGVDVICQTTGSYVLGSDIWDHLSNGAYVSDYWLNTPVFDGYSPGLPQCGSQPAPTPTPTPTPTATVGRTVSYDQGYPGQCTWWADYEFHAFSGLWPDFTGPNNGNAEYWASNAAAKGWTVVSHPVVHSVAVFPPGANYAGSVGHVAWVYAVSGNTISVSEMNFTYGPYRTDTRTMVPASSVRYILAP
jgi:surface antigen